MEGRVIICVLVMDKILKYFENDKLTITRHYTKNLLGNEIEDFLCPVTILEIVSGNHDETRNLVSDALMQLSQVLPGASVFFQKKKE